MRKLFTKSLLIAVALLFIAVPSYAWMIVTDVGASNELIDNSTDDMIDFQGRGGADNTDLRLDLDGTHPVLSSATDSIIELSGTAILNTVTIATALTISEDFVISLDAADEEIAINQTAVAGTEDVGLIKINDDRTGATATEQSEATIWIDAQGVFAIAAIDGAIAAEGGFFPDAADGAALGSTALEFADLFLADSSTIQFGADQDITITHAADTGLAITGTTTFATAASPDASDGATLGSATAEWSDLFLADAGVIQLGADQDMSITHVADVGIAITGTTTFATAANPDAADGAALGTTTAEWSDLFLADAGALALGADQDVLITHVADSGVSMRTTSTTAPFVIVLQTSDTTVADGGKLGQIDFQAPLEVSGTDAILVGASIWAEADNTFAVDNNATELVFATAITATAAEVMRLDQAGNLGINTAIPATLLEVQGDAGAPGIETLSTAELTVVDGDELGRINFQAPLETGADAILVSAAIYAESDITFDATNNATSIVFALGVSEAASEKARIDSVGNFLSTGDIGSATSELDDIFLQDSSVINLGADQDVTLTHVPDVGVVVNLGMSARRIVTTTGAERVLTAAELGGGIVLVTAAVEVQLPDVCDSATGAYVTIVQADASEVIQIAVTDTSDDMYLDGVALGANQEIDSAGAAQEDDYITLYCREANEWHQLDKTGTFVDGGAAD